jgi:hypothetical protein
MVLVVVQKQKEEVKPVLRLCSKVLKILKIKREHRQILDQILVAETTFQTVHWAPTGALFCGYNMRVQMKPT